jgi:hypothetical protein
MHTAEPFLSEPSVVEVGVAFVKLKSYKSLGAGLISSELFQAGEKKLLSEIHKLLKLIWNRELLPHQRKE